MNAKKRRLEPLSFYNHTGIEQHLSDMARKGWMIERISNYYWTYRKIEPQELQFTVSYYPKASDFDPAPSEAQQTLMDFCAETGWDLACTWYQMQIFYHAGPDPIPIHTDPALEVEAIHKACKANYLRGYKLLLVLSLIGTFFFLSALISDTLRLLASPSDLTTGMVYLLLFLLCAVELGTYYGWHRKAKKAAEHEIFLDTPSTSAFQKGILAIFLLVIAYWVINLIFSRNPLMAWVYFAVSLAIFTTVILSNAVKRFLKRKGASSGQNRFCTIAASFVIAFVLFGVVLTASSRIFSDSPKGSPSLTEEIPLRVSDLLDTDYSDYITEHGWDESIFLARLHFNQRHGFDDAASPDIPEIRCELYTVKLPALYELCKGQLKRQLSISEFWSGELVAQDPAPWGADEVYQQIAEDGAQKQVFLLCYEGMIVRIEFNWELTDGQRAIVGEKIKGD